MTNSAVTGRVLAGDRCFVSSDHSESLSGAITWNLNNGALAFGVSQFISVNRAGSVPPAVGDQLSGASVTASSSTLTLDPYCNAYWQGITFSVNGNFYLAGGANKKHYFRNCAISLTVASGVKIQPNNPCAVTLDNTTVQFANVGQGFQWNNYAIDFLWINTPSAIVGATIPTALFASGANPPMAATVRGVDLSALTTNLLALATNSFGKLLLDSCRIASGLTRSVAPSTSQMAADEIELVNCYDGTNILSERHAAAGDVTTNRTTTLTGGAQDDVGLFSHQLVSSTRADMLAVTLDSFWMDVENPYTGASHTATVEIISSASLNNTDISLQLEYLGTTGSSLASFSSSLPSALTTSAALPTSTATWNSPPATPVAQHIQVTFTPQQLGRLRGIVRLGKPSTTVYVNPQITVS